MIRPLSLLAGLLLVVGGCSGSPGASVSPAPSAPVTASSSPAASPSTGRALSVAELKLAVIRQFGPLWYCDPDFYPIARADEIDLARQRWAEVSADPATLAAIAADLGLALGASPTDEQKLAVYRVWKTLNAIALEPVGNGTYRFDYLAEPARGATDGTRSRGTITTTGAIAIEHQAPEGQPNCPICLARGTRIETPGGSAAVETLRIGDRVWTLDPAGQRVVGTVLALGSTRAPAGHRVVHVVLADGRSVTASPGHPLADGRRLGDLRAGDIVGGSRVVTADLVPYTGGATFDIVVSGATGDYLVDGIALGSTLRR